MPCWHVSLICDVATEVERQSSVWSYSSPHPIVDPLGYKDCEAGRNPLPEVDSNLGMHPGALCALAVTVAKARALKGSGIAG